ncbi:hypothetical protein DVH24_002931 [Malus domestica]|uniref:Uncharacterized protein n=1 Tax=Malus domestica TaxID=3750 RepID=A0A498KBD7_MALDO|nr:hypothetical protein DVH24_002931 [Malus domestica]
MALWKLIDMRVVTMFCSYRKTEGLLSVSSLLPSPGMLVQLSYFALGIGWTPERNQDIMLAQLALFLQQLLLYLVQQREVMAGNLIGRSYIACVWLIQPRVRILGRLCMDVNLLISYHVLLLALTYERSKNLSSHRSK